MAGWADRLKASAFSQPPASGEYQWPGTGAGATVLENTQPGAEFPYPGSGGRALETSVPTAAEMSEKIVPGVSEAMDEGRKQSLAAAVAAGQAPGQSVANMWTPPEPGSVGAGSAAPMPPMKISLGHSSRTWSESTQSPAISPEQAAGLNADLEAGRASRGLAREQLGLIAQSQARDIGDAIRERDRKVALAKAQQAKELAAVEERRVAQEQRNDEILKSIKPDFNYYRGKWGGLRAMGDAIAIGLSGMAQAQVAGINARMGKPVVLGKNPIVASIEKAYELDMKAQLAEMADRKWKYQQGRNMLADLRLQAGDIKQALALAKASYYDEAASRFEAIKTEWGGKAAPWEQDVKKSLEDEATRARQLAVQVAGTARKTTTRGGSSGGSQAINPAYTAALKGQGAGAGRPLPGKLADGIGAIEAFALRVNQFEKDYMPEASKLGHSVNATLGKLWGSKAAMLEEQKGSIIAELRKAKESGVMTEPDFKRYVGRMPTLLDRVPIAAAKFKSIKNDLAIEYGAKLRNLGRANFDVSGYPTLLGAGGQ
jgi:hypothetical protein